MGKTVHVTAGMSGTHIGPADFEQTEISFAIEIPIDAFNALEASESYRTDHAAFKNGQRTLCDKLEDTPAGRIEYNGHFGNFIFFSMPAGDVTPANKLWITQIINDHLDWCLSLGQEGQSPSLSLGEEA